MNHHTMPSAAAPWSYRRLLPVLVLAGGLGAFFLLGLERYLSFDTLRVHHEGLRVWVQGHGLLAVGAYMAVYVVAVAFSLPGGAVLSIAGGLLFGTLWGAAYIVISATLGATVLFLIAKTALGDPLRARAGPWLHRLQAGFQHNALSYLLVLRLVPLFPFFVVNLVPAFLGVRLSTYVVGTFVGIIPGTVVYAGVGAGLGTIFAAGGTVGVSGILTPQLLMALMGLAALALVPVAYRKLAGRAVSPAPGQQGGAIS